MLCDRLRTPNGIRTRATAVKGRGPRPLDDGGQSHRDVAAAAEDRAILGRGDEVGQTAALRCPGHNGGVIEMSRDRFEELVSEALDTVPPELAALIDNCVVLVEDDAPAHDPQLLGLYDGIPLTERGQHYSMAMPDRITIYRNPTLAICDEEEHVVEEVGITVVHEIAHHFGIDDDRLHELGYA